MLFGLFGVLLTSWFQISLNFLNSCHLSKGISILLLCISLSFFLSAVFSLQNILLSTKSRRNKTWKNCFETEERIRYDNWYDDGLEIFFKCSSMMCLLGAWMRSREEPTDIVWIVLYIDKTCSAIWTKSFVEENKQTPYQMSCLIVWFIRFKGVQWGLKQLSFYF